MKRKQRAIKEFNFYDYDFSDCVEITGDDLYLINGGAEIENSVEAQSLYSYICEGETGRMLCESFTQKIPLFHCMTQLDFISSGLVSTAYIVIIA